jgi:hypothetical protein
VPAVRLAHPTGAIIVESAGTRVIPPQPQTLPEIPLMLRILVSVLTFFALTPCLPGVEPGEILPRDVTYAAGIPKPSEFFGFSVGHRHLHHHELVDYLRALAQASDRVVFQEYGRSYGGRPLCMLTVTSAENHARLDSIRQAHLALAEGDASAQIDLRKHPVVVNLGYCVHGNEPSGGNAVPLIAYYLAAGKSKWHQRLLQQAVLLLDPCINPDGFDRFAQWATDHRGAVPNPDPQHREHRETWPGGRTNYYWFDLNRDWLPAQQPESRGRLGVYHRWKPNVVLDFHEMGTTATYFFQPGVPERNHPLTPAATFELTRAFAEYNAQALDGIGSLYFTEERFDDFYMGKGSTYPDLHGAVGILFEQASSRGQLQESPNGVLSFPFTIRNQFVTTLSSLKAALAKRIDLLEHQQTFYGDARALARNAAARAYLVTAPGDPRRLRYFLEVLEAHDIASFELAKDVTIDGLAYRAGEAYVIPTEQAEFRFLQSLFETRTQFRENVFYDVSTWTLPLAFNLQVGAVKEGDERKLRGAPFAAGQPPARAAKIAPRALAYLVDWRAYHAPRILHQLLAADVKVKVATSPFSARLGNQDFEFGYGTLLVPMGIQQDRRGEVLGILKQADRHGVPIHSASTGLTPRGMDLGSSGFRVIPPPRVALITGSGVSSNEAGEVWHLLDRRVAMPLTHIDASRLSSVNLDDYTAIVLVSGSYGSITESGKQRLGAFVERGGTLIGLGTAASWIDKGKMVEVNFQEAKQDAESETAAPPTRRPYDQASRDASERLVSGSIFRTQVDATHPIGYGYAPGHPLPVFRNNRTVLGLASSAYSSPVVYDAEPLLSGYISPENLQRLKGAASVTVYEQGSGRVILMSDNPNFRAFWYGTNRLFLNGVFFGPIIRVP